MPTHGAGSLPHPGAHSGIPSPTGLSPWGWGICLNLGGQQSPERPYAPAITVKGAAEASSSCTVLSAVTALGPTLHGSSQCRETTRSLAPGGLGFEFPAPPLHGCVALDKPCHLSEPHSLSYETAVKIFTPAGSWVGERIS